MYWCHSHDRAWGWKVNDHSVGFEIQEAKYSLLALYKTEQYARRNTKKNTALFPPSTSNSNREIRPYVHIATKLIIISAALETLFTKCNANKMVGSILNLRHNEF